MIDSRWITPCTSPLPPAQFTNARLSLYTHYRPLGGRVLAVLGAPLAAHEYQRHLNVEVHKYL